MSSRHSFGLEILITDLLVSGIKSLALAISQRRELKDETGQKHEVDFVIENERKEKIGVRKHAKGHYEFVPEKIDSQATKDTIKKVRQAYARLKILDEVKKKGYQQVKEEKLQDGSIRLVVEKWQ